MGGGDPMIHRSIDQCLKYHSMLLPSSVAVSFLVPRGIV
uniref:Uncharacterized protein n=1 Tax=Anguilla anguilla TaxID=7936 RepID=A0A0E9W965_ANGAN